jgi:hypothetical protein
MRTPRAVPAPRVSRKLSTYSREASCLIHLSTYSREASCLIHDWLPAQDLGEPPSPRTAGGGAAGAAGGGAGVLAKDLSGRGGAAGGGSAGFLAKDGGLARFLSRGLLGTLAEAGPSLRSPTERDQVPERRAPAHGDAGGAGGGDAGVGAGGPDPLRGRVPALYSAEPPLALEPTDLEAYRAYLDPRAVREPPLPPTPEAGGERWRIGVWITREGRGAGGA